MTLYPKLILDALATVRYPGTDLVRDHPERERIWLKRRWLPTISVLMECLSVSL